MPEFVYTARTAAGERVNGKIAAANRNEAVTLLINRALFPSDVQAEKPKLSLSLGGGVKGQVMAVTYGQLASLLRSGVPLMRSLTVLQDQTSHPRLKTVLDDVKTRVEDGTEMSEAMARHPKVFNHMAVSMVKAGTEGGFLEEALERVAKFTEQYEDLKARTTGALAYPTFLAVVGSSVVAALVIFFVPKFATLFDRLREKGELPPLTDWLLWFSESIQSYWLPLLVIGGVGGVFLYLRGQTPAGKRFVDAWKLRLPVIGGIFQNLAVARFCRVLGTLLHNGVPILRSLEISREAAGNVILSEAIGKASENISSGQSLAQPLASSGHFPKIVVEMIAVAEESNTLDEVLVEVSDGLEKRTERRLELFVRLLEPIMLLVLAGMVLVVVIALLLPVIKMSSTL